jgi:phage terminase large subunit-like protein
MPEARIHEKSLEDRVPYEMWTQQGWITATPGDIIDQDFIEKDIRDACDLFDVVKIGYDPWNASQIVSHLKNEGMELVSLRQGYATMSPFSKNFETLLRSRRINHGNNPVLAWNMSCTTLKQDENENIRPVKPDRKTGKRIDGIVATIMALGLSMEGVEDTADDGKVWVV